MKPGDKGLDLRGISYAKAQAHSESGREVIHSALYGI